MAEQAHSRPDRRGGASYADARERYRLETRIATGGMGQVWRAQDTVLDRPVAVKLLKQEHTDDPVFRSRFQTEAHNAAGLNHPGIARVFDFGVGDPDHPPYLVMEYVDGRPLSALLRPGVAMEPDAAATLVAAAGDALGAAHARGIVHRDVKPANILVTDDHHVRLTDFGIARAADAATLTRTGEVLGTPQYLSPEQAEGSPATPASDVYSLAVVAFECLAGRRPFQAETPVATVVAHLRAPVPDLPGTVPPPLASVVRRGLAKVPAERFADGSAFAAAVREAATSSTAVLPPVAVAPATTGDGRRVPLPVWVAAAALVVVIAVAALAASTGPGAGPSPADRRTGSGATTPSVDPNAHDADSGPGNANDGGPDKGKDSGSDNAGGIDNSGQVPRKAKGPDKAKGPGKGPHPAKNPGKSHRPKGAGKGPGHDNSGHGGGSATDLGHGKQEEGPP